MCLVHPSRHAKLAFSPVTIHEGNIRTRLQGSPLGGTNFGETRGFHHGEAQAIAARMVLQARINADAMFNQRTGDLVSSVVPIVKTFGNAGTEIGVGTTAKHGAVLEVGAPPHVIQPQGTGYLLRSDGPRSKGGNPTPLDRPQRLVVHPGTPARHWLSDAVRAVLPGLFVRVVHAPLEGSDGR